MNKLNYYIELAIHDKEGTKFEMINTRDEVSIFITNACAATEITFTGKELELLRRLIQ